MIAENQRLIRVKEAGDRLTCIVCPIGCSIEVEQAEDGSIEVSGNRCRRGEAYAREEFSDPRRIITGTCAVDGGEWVRVPVRSSDGVPIESIERFLNAMYELRLHVPIDRGVTLARDLGGTGVDLIATMTVRRSYE